MRWFRLSLSFPFPGCKRRRAQTDPGPYFISRSIPRSRQLVWIGWHGDQCQNNALPMRQEVTSPYSSQCLEAPFRDLVWLNEGCSPKDPFLSEAALKVKSNVHVRIDPRIFFFSFWGISASNRKKFDTTIGM